MGEVKPSTLPDTSALGMPTLALVSQRWTIAILRELEVAPLRPHELERRLHGLSHAGLMRRLAELVRYGAISRVRTRDIPPRAHYGLTERGARLLAIVDRAARLEERTRVRIHTVAGAWALRAVADGRSLTLLRELSDRPAGPREVGRRVTAIGRMGHAALMRRLTAMSDDGLVRRVEQGAQVLYEVPHDTRLLAALPILAMSMERERLHGDGAPSGDLLGMLRLLAPTVALPEHLAGDCRLEVRGGRDRERVLILRARDGALAAVPESSFRPPPACASGSLAAWLTLFAAESAAVLTTRGDHELLDGVLAALRRAVGDAARVIRLST